MSRRVSKDQILASAVELFLTRGFAEVSTRDLATHAGLSRSHIYYYFSDWRQLRKEAFIRFSDTQIEEVRAMVAGQPPLEALERYLLACLPMRLDSAFALWNDAWGQAMHDPDLAAAYVEINAQWHRFLEQLIMDGIASGVFRTPSAKRAARQLFALAMGYVDLMLAPSEEAAAATLVEVMEVVRLLLDVKV